MLHLVQLDRSQDGAPQLVVDRLECVELFLELHELSPFVGHQQLFETQVIFQVHAVTEGTDAQAEVSVRLAEEGKTVTARAADPDTLVASAKAYIGALNRLLIKRKRGKPEAMSAAE